MSYGQEALPPEGTFEKVPGSIAYVRDHLDEPRMQAVVALSVAGSFAVTAALVNAFTQKAKTEEERIAMRNVPKLLGLAALVYGTFYLLDVDKKWWRAETAAKEVETWIEGQF